MGSDTPYYQPPPHPPVTRRSTSAGNRNPIRWASYSLRGIEHETNQDAVLVHSRSGYFAVADGVGGGSHGEIASQVALDTLAQIQTPKPRALLEQLRRADERVRMALASLSDQPGATTLAVLWLKRHQATVLWVGDARILHMTRDRQGKWRVTWRSTDQTYASVGETPQEGSGPDDPARMVGTDMIDDPGIRRFLFATNAMILLCSDGLHRYVDESMLLTHLQANMEEDADLDEMARQLCLLAQRHGSPDDISIILLHRPNPAFKTWLVWLLLATILLWLGINLDIMGMLAELDIAVSIDLITESLMAQISLLTS